MNDIITILRESRLARFLIPAGIILIICGIIFTNATVKNKDYIKIESEVTKVELEEEAHKDASGNQVEATYILTLKYTVGGKTYESDLGGLSERKVGDKMTIYYNPEDPSQITQTKSLIVPLAMIIAGIAALVGGILSAVSTVKKYKRMKEQERGWANGEL